MLDLALKGSGGDSARVKHKPRLLSDNGPCYIAGDLAEWLNDHKMDHVRGPPRSSGTRQDRALAPEPQDPHLTGKLLPAWRPRNPDRRPTSEVGIRRSHIAQVLGARMPHFSNVR